MDNIKGQEIKIGDTVKIKSGGPLMTVSEIGVFGSARYNENPYLSARCIWFDDKNNHKEQIFPLHSLDFIP